MGTIETNPASRSNGSNRKARQKTIQISRSSVETFLRYNQCKSHFNCCNTDLPKGSLGSGSPLSRTLVEQMIDVKLLLNDFASAETLILQLLNDEKNQTKRAQYLLY